MAADTITTFENSAKACVQIGVSIHCSIPDRAYADRVQFVLFEAERHARLLQALWEWVHSESEPILIPHGERDVFVKNGGVTEAKFYVRSLLVGQHEDK